MLAFPTISGGVLKVFAYDSTGRSTTIELDAHLPDYATITPRSPIDYGTIIGGSNVSITLDVGIG